MNSKKRWTKEEEQVLFSKVSDNPGNLSLAFKEAAQDLDRTVDAIKQYWYYKLRKKGHCFITYSGRSLHINNKNVQVTRPDNTIRLIKNKLKAIIALILK